MTILTSIIQLLKKLSQVHLCDKGKENNLFFVLYGSQLWVSLAVCVFQRELQQYLSFHLIFCKCDSATKQEVAPLSPGIWARPVTALTNNRI